MSFFINLKNAIPIVFILLKISNAVLSQSNSSSTAISIPQGNIQDYFIKFGNEDKYLNTSLLLKKYGYNVEEYWVETEDGYLLSVVRVPGRGPAVLLMHGIFSSSDTYLTGGAGAALAYVLADAGYDVWLGNARGNKYSTRHATLSPHQRQFWEFSWHEIGAYDLPAMIDHALRVSGREQLTYVGHSQGTTAYYVLCSTRPEYNDKISLAFSLAPIAYIYHAFSPLIQLSAPFQGIEYSVLYDTGFYDFLPFRPFQIVTSVLCDLSLLAQLFCRTVFFNFVGYNYAQINPGQASVQFSHIPSGSSVKQMTHYLQNVNSKGFNHYDYGKAKNLKLYGSEAPPGYPLENITVPTYLMYSTNDYLSSYEDVRLLAARLPRVARLSRVQDPLFNHMDYVWAKDVKELVNLKVLKVLNEYYKK